MSIAIFPDCSTRVLEPLAARQMLLSSSLWQNPHSTLSRRAFPHYALLCDRDRADRFVKELGHCDLAITQACAYIKSTGCGPDAYMELFRGAGNELLRRQVVENEAFGFHGRLGTSERAACKTTLLAVEKIDYDSASELASDMLRALAEYPDGSCCDLICIGEYWGDVERAKRLLVDYALVEPGRNMRMRPFVANVINALCPD